MVMRGTQVRHARSAPSPLVGEGWGEGWTRVRCLWSPPSLSLPHKGGGNVAARAVRNVLRASLASLVLVAAFAVATPAAAQTVEQFYRGRTINLIVGFNPGGAYDPYARSVARHLPKHLPGAPNVVVKNMQGAGSVLAANHLYKVSPKDGSE